MSISQAIQADPLCKICALYTASPLNLPANRRVRRPKQNTTGIPSHRARRVDWSPPTVLERFDGFTRGNALLAIFFSFLIPGIPDDILCFVVGLTDIRLWKLVIVSFVGRIPSFLLVSVIGVELASANLLTALALAAGFITLALVTYHYRGRFIRRFDPW